MAWFHGGQPVPKPVPRAVTQRADARAKQRAWLAVRRQVLVRDGYRCRACGTRELVDVHHVRFRSHGGKDVLRNLLALCRADHALVHAYRLEIGGTDANGPLTFTITERD